MGNLPSGLHLAVGAYNMAGVQDLVDQGLQPLCPSCGVHLGGEGSRVDVKGQSRHPHPVRHGQGSLPLPGVMVQLPFLLSDGNLLFRQCMVKSCVPQHNSRHQVCRVLAVVKSVRCIAQNECMQRRVK